MDNDFLKRHARHMKARELLKYLQIEGAPPLVRDCIETLNAGAALQEEELRGAFEEKEEEMKEKLSQKLEEAEDSLLSRIRNASYDDLESVISDAFEEIREHLDLPD